MAPNEGFLYCMQDIWWKATARIVNKSKRAIEVCGSISPFSLHNWDLKKIIYDSLSIFRIINLCCNIENQFHSHSLLFLQEKIYLNIRKKLQWRPTNCFYMSKHRKLISMQESVGKQPLRMLIIQLFWSISYSPLCSPVIPEINSIDIPYTTFKISIIYPHKLDFWKMAPNVGVIYTKCSKSRNT